MVADDPESFADLDGHCPVCEALEEIAETPQGKWAIDHAIGLVVAGGAAIYADSKGLFDKAVDALSQNPGDFYAGDSNGHLTINPLLQEQIKLPTSPPNPNGSKGAPDHQQTADEEAAKYPNGQREVTVDTPGGEKGSRRIDAANVENGKVTAATQVIRPNKNGTPPAREVRAAKDIENATGVKPTFVPVRPIIPKPVPLVDPTPPEL